MLSSDRNRLPTTLREPVAVGGPGSRGGPHVSVSRHAEVRFGMLIMTIVRALPPHCA
jgi:hypothetical protein